MHGPHRRTTHDTTAAHTPRTGRNLQFESRLAQNAAFRLQKSAVVPNQAFRGTERLESEPERQVRAGKETRPFEMSRFQFRQLQDNENVQETFWKHRRL